nr:polyadenylate-binding protein 2-like [Ipomoea batatas]
MNPILTTVGAVAAVAKVASTAYYYAEHFGVLNRESKADQAETRSVEAAEKQSADVGIPVFHGSGYEIWSSMMKTFFVSQDLWDMVEGGYVEEELTVEVLREVRKKDAMALLFIQQAIDQSFFSCIAGACKSKEAWDALANKYQGDVLEPNQQSPVDLSCPADAIESREEARDALEVESRGYTDEPNRKKAVDELVLSYAADATDPKEVARDAPEQGYKANTKVVEANRIGVEFGDFNRNCGFKEWCSANSDSGWGGGCDDRHLKMSYSDNSTPVAESAFHSKLKLSEDGIGKESGDVKNNNSGSKKGSNRGGRGGRNCGRFNNNRGGRGGRDGECSNNQGFHGGTENGDFNNSLGGRGGQGSGHINNNRGGRGGRGSGHINNNRGGRGGKGRGHINNKQGGRGGKDHGHFNNGSEAADYYSKSATETNEALDAHTLQQGHQANTEVKDQAHVGNPSGGTIFIKNLDRAIDDVALHAMFSAFGNILSCKVETDASGQSKGYGRIEYDSEEAAREAIEKANGSKLLNGKKMYVEPFVRKQGRAKAMETTNFTNVFVGNLSVSTTEKDLREVFGNFGTIVNAVVVKDGDGKSEGFGFVNFNDAYDAAWSVDVLNGHEFDNKVWYVRRAYQKKNVGKAQKKIVDESVPSSTAKATESKKSGDAISQKKCNGKAQKKYVPSSTTNETESKKAVEAVQKGYRANTIVLYVDDKGVGHFKLKSP